MKSTFWDNYADRQMQTIEHYEEKKRQADKLVWFKDKLANSDDRHLVELSKISDSQLVILMKALSPLDKPTANFADVYVANKTAKKSRRTRQTAKN